MKTYRIEYIVSDKHGKTLADGQVTMRGKNKKDLMNFIVSRKFLQLEKGEEITITDFDIV
jgi:hypothetical protein